MCNGFADTDKVCSPHITASMTVHLFLYVGEVWYSVLMIRASHKIFHSVRYAIKGLIHAYRKDESFRLELRVGLPIYLVLGYVFFPFAPWEFALFVFSYLFILTVELVNTAFETMLDKLHPEQHETIGRSKDISAAGVLLAFVFAILVMAILAWERLPAGEGVRIVQYFA